MGKEKIETRDQRKEVEVSRTYRSRVRRSVGQKIDGGKTGRTQAEKDDRCGHGQMTSKSGRNYTQCKINKNGENRPIGPHWSQRVNKLLDNN